MTPIAVAIVNYHTREHLRACLATVQLEAPSETVVVDNASSDGSADMVRAEYPWVTLHANKMNPGYGPAANRAIASCTAEYVLLLNSDTLLQAGGLMALSGYLDAHPCAAIVGPRLVEADGTLQVPISLGAIQKVLDRVSQAIAPHSLAMATQTRHAPVNSMDETPWCLTQTRQWLWGMVRETAALSMLHPHRSKEACAVLIDDGAGILVSDGYGVYQHWVQARQTCLAHLIRSARGLAARADEAGRFARRLLREMDSLWVFLAQHGVEPTNNRAERA